MKYGLRVCLKRWKDRGELDLDRARSKNNIAENSVALGHDAHNRFLILKVNSRMIRYLNIWLTVNENNHNSI